MMVLFMLFFALHILLFFFLLNHRNKRKTLLPPGPSGLPIIGNLHQLDNSSPHLYLWELSKKYGPLMSLQLGFVPTIIVSSAKMAKEVLKIHDHECASRQSLLGQKKLSYNCLDLAFTPYSEYWREMRKLCVLQLFSSKRVQSFRNIRENEVSLMIKKISRFASESKVVNLSEILVALTSTIICRTAFGKRYDDEGQERSRFHSLLNESQALMAAFFVTDFFPSMGWVDKVNGLRGRLEKNFKDMDAFYQELIDDHLDPNRPKPEQDDFLDVLLRLRSERLFAFDLTLDHIKAVLMNVFVAGTDTSAATTVWAMTLLMKNPRVMKKIQKEILNTIGDKGFVQEEDLEKLPYLKAVVKETMRFQPSVPLLIPHETLQSCYIDGYKIPAKTLVYINAWAVGRDPEAWNKPEEFFPERFIGTSIDFKGQHFQLIPFGAGRRGCPGIYMGALNVELALANLLYSFEWKQPAGTEKEDIDMDSKPGVAMHKKNALCLVAKNNVMFKKSMVE